MGVPAAAACALAATLLAGCLAPPEEATACPERSFVTVHYAAGLDPGNLSAALRELGWTEVASNDFLSPRAGVRAVVSLPSGSSSPGGVLSFEETGEPGDVRAQARAVALYVNETRGDPPLDAWIEGRHERCPPDAPAPWTPFPP